MSMTKIKELRNKVVFKSIFGIVLMLGIFSFAVNIIGFNGFTEALLNQYAEGAFYTADMASYAVDPDKMEEYLSSNWETEEYKTAWGYLDRICNSSGATFVYVVMPDLTDYEHITFVFSTINHDSPYSLYELGYVRPTTNDEYKEKYKRLYSGASERELLIRDKGFIETDPHITAMIPLKGTDGTTKALMCVQRQMDSMVAARNAFVKKILLVLLGLAIIVIIGQSLYLYHVFLRPIAIITKEASRFATDNGTLDKRLSDIIHNQDEIGILAGSIDQMELQIVSYVDNLTRVTAEKERISTELDMAAGIQKSQLPMIFPPYPDRSEFHIFASMTPAKTVGGDFYDFFLVDNDHLALVIADVSGKGIPAALFMMISRILIKTRLQNGETPGETLYNVNNQLLDGSETGMFVTVWIAVIEISTGNGVAVNAGHEHPVLRRANGDFELVLYKHSPAIATMEDLSFKEHTFTLYPGDCIFVYTDGVAEATNAHEELFGTTRMLDALNKDPYAELEVLLNNVKNAINEFVGDAEQFDDITMLSISYSGPTQSQNA